MQTYEMTIPADVTVVSDTDKTIRLVERGPDGNIVSDVEDRPWSLFRLLCTFVFVRPDWRQPYARSMLAHEIAAIVKGAEPGTDIDLTAEQWEALRDTFMHKEFELPEHYSYQLVPLIAAVLAARPKQLKSVPEAPEPEAATT